MGTQGNRIARWRNNQIMFRSSIEGHLCCDHYSNNAKNYYKSEPRVLVSYLFVHKIDITKSLKRSFLR